MQQPATRSPVDNRAPTRHYVVNTGLRRWDLSEPKVCSGRFLARRVTGEVRGDHLCGDLNRFIFLLGGSDGEQVLADDHDQHRRKEGRRVTDIQQFVSSCCDCANSPE
jgi:hypothetical protein